MKLEPGLQLTGQWVWVVYIVISFNFSRSFAHVYWEPARCRSQREVFIRLKGGIPDMLLGRMWTVFHKKLKTPCLCPQLGSFLAWIWAERYFSHQKGSHQTPLRCCSRAENAGWAGLAGGLGARDGQMGLQPLSQGLGGDWHPSPPNTAPDSGRHLVKPCRPDRRCQSV